MKVIQPKELSIAGILLAFVTVSCSTTGIPLTITICDYENSPWRTEFWRGREEDNGQLRN